MVLEPAFNLGLLAKPKIVNINLCLQNAEKLSHMWFLHVSAEDTRYTGLFQPPPWDSPWYLMFLLSFSYEYWLESKMKSLLMRSPYLDLSNMKQMTTPWQHFIPKVAVMNPYLLLDTIFHSGGQMERNQCTMLLPQRYCFHSIHISVWKLDLYNQPDLK